MLGIILLSLFKKINPKGINPKKIILLVGIFFIFLLSLSLHLSQKNSREIANFSTGEIEYAEKFLLDDEKFDDSKLSSHPAWKDDLERKQKLTNTIEQKIEQKLKDDYEQDLLQVVEEKTGRRARKSNLEENLNNLGHAVRQSHQKALKEKMIKEVIENAKRDGVNLVYNPYTDTFVVKEPSDQ